MNALLTHNTSTDTLAQIVRQTYPDATVSRSGRLYLITSDDTGITIGIGHTKAMAWTRAAVEVLASDRSNVAIAARLVFPTATVEETPASLHNLAPWRVVAYHGGPAVGEGATPADAWADACRSACEHNA